MHVVNQRAGAFVTQGRRRQVKPGRDAQAIIGGEGGIFAGREQVLADAQDALAGVGGHFLACAAFNGVYLDRRGSGRIR